MLTRRKIRIVPAGAAHFANTTYARLFNSAYKALEYEKSLEILDENTSEQPEFILPTGPDGTDGSDGRSPDEKAQLICAAPMDHRVKVNHSLATGESLHGYFTQGHKLLTLHHLPQINPKTVLNIQDILNPADPAHHEATQQIQNQRQLCGPWHATAISKDELTLSSYAAPDHVPLFSAIGINWYLLAAFEAAGKPISILQQDLRGVAILSNEGQPRLQVPTSKIYLDLDDTLIIHRAVNPHVRELLTKCVRASVPVHLITRHARDPQLTLKDYNIPVSLFTSIIWITDGSPKSAHMTADGNAIFIDDAYQERVEVSTRLSMLSVPPEAAELLHL